NVISRFDYANDAIGRRASITRSGSAFSSLSGSVDHYGYNDRSEVVSAHRTLNGEEVRGFSFGYAYDPIGNRTSSTEWDENGVAHTSHYAANELNEYESRTVPGHVTVLGEAATDATVTVNGNPAWRKGAYFAGGDDFDNVSSGVFAELATTAVRSASEVDEVESSIGNKFLPQSPETFTYDEDGNMTSDGRFTYTWDAENRMIAAEQRNDFGLKRSFVLIENCYDHQSRRIEKHVLTNSATKLQTTFRYDDWNLIVELQSMINPTEKTAFVWGLDLSGTIHDAVGVGGLVLLSNSNGIYLPALDGNGTVYHYVDLLGMPICCFDYLVNGNPIVTTDMKGFHICYSTRYWDEELSEYYYGLRFYSPMNGRWLSTDPIEEMDGVNRYSFVNNSFVSSFDVLGMYKFHIMLYEVDPIEDDELYSVIIDHQLTCSDEGRVVNVDGGDSFFVDILPFTDKLKDNRVLVSQEDIKPLSIRKGKHDLIVDYRAKALFDAWSLARGFATIGLSAATAASTAKSFSKDGRVIAAAAVAGGVAGLLIADWKDPREVKCTFRVIYNCECDPKTQKWVLRFKKSPMNTERAYGSWMELEWRDK
ncbi:MAG: RHS repeat-associated core domain-containing protein, partial [Muribaculaceae bacterium]|nr:RHS repeat-associated core domain-containing protein [Muribaculaceae bacterium]